MTRLHAVPALMAQVVELAERSGARFPRLRTLFVGGDAVPAELLMRMRAVFPAAELCVLYGPTEATIIWAISFSLIFLRFRLFTPRGKGDREGRKKSGVE